ncbi:MAG: leucine-rich repeat domain-containing protein, partial [Lachnospiraceae bacterium]|nr:leucine-rich repeat domain-containing protein [Lachnospiraceae bacterium]
TIAVVMCLCGLWGDFKAGAADSDEFVIEKGNLVQYNGTGGDIVIPDSVQKIGKEVFKDNTSITGVTFPTGLISIGNEAFRGCKNLAELKLPEKLSTIGRGTFRDCTAIREVRFPDTLTSITSEAFMNCQALENITFSPRLFSIGGSAFGGCSALKEVTLPDSLSAIEAGAFSNCTNLVSIEIPKKVTKISGCAFCNCENLIRVALPDGIEEIEASAFYKCLKLADINLPSALKKIGDTAFFACESLTKIVIPWHVTYIGNSAFWCAGVTELTLPSELNYLGWGAFCMTRITSVTIPEGLTRLEGSTFGGCWLKSVTIPASIYLIDQKALAVNGAIKDVYFGGTKTEWSKIVIKDGNKSLESAEIHFDGPVETEVKHLYQDYAYQNPVLTTTIQLFANGTAVTKNGEKTNYKSATLYTDILASYKYTVDKKGKLSTSTGKVIVGITCSSQKPQLSAKNVIVDKEGAKIAKASIKNGQITVTAKNSAGRAYLWVMDTGAADVSVCCPINVKAAPTAIHLYSSPDFVYGETAKYTKADIELGESADIILYPTYKNSDRVLTKATGVTYTVALDSNAESHFAVKKSGNEHFVVTAKSLKENKKVSGKINFICDQNGKKVTFTATAVQRVRKVSIVQGEGNWDGLYSKNYGRDLLLKSSAATASKGILDITATGRNTGIAVTETPKLYALSGPDSYDPVKFADGAVKDTGTRTAGQKKISASLSKDTKTIKVSMPKGMKTGVTAYFILVYNTGEGGYIRFSVTSI